MKENQGITLIALIITIIVLLILAGVSISLVVGDNGVLTQAQNASKKTTAASEKEAIEFVMSDVQVDILTDKEVPESKLIGDKLSGFSAVENWKSVIVGDKTYEDGWYLIEKEDNIPSYGKAKSNWLINYNKGEIIELEDDGYRIANAKASGALVDDTLKLNIDPSNLQDRSKWENNGIKVSFVGEESEGDLNSGVKETEIKFDGSDDYLKIEGIDTSKSDGITFEFYGKSDGTQYFPLTKTYFKDNKIDLSGIISSFRFKRFEEGTETLNCCFGVGNSLSDKPWKDLEHWISFELPKNDSFEYYTVTIKNPTEVGEDYRVSVYQNGENPSSTYCAYDYIMNGDLVKSEVPFTVGLCVSTRASTGEGVAEYGKFDLYACRLYTRVLTDEEIGQNYTATTKYHNDLVNSVSE